MPDASASEWAHIVYVQRGLAAIRAESRLSRAARAEHGRSAAAARGGGREAEWQVGDPALARWRAEPFRDLRSEAGGAAGVSRTVGRDRDERLGYSHFRATSAAREA